MPGHDDALIPGAMGWRQPARAKADQFVFVVRTSARIFAFINEYGLKPALLTNRGQPAGCPWHSKSALYA
jgi:hypothetical protein